MNAYDYLIIGGGMTADAAVKGIRERDPKGSIAILTDELDPPYSRPPLTKGLWNGKKKVEDIGCGTAERGVRLVLNRKVVEINRSDHCVIDSANEVHGYNRLLLATGGTPRRLPFGGESVMYYRTLADYRLLLARLEDRTHVAIVGGGFIGSELAAALRGKGLQVTMIFPEDHPGAGVFPVELAERLNGYYREKGITLLENQKLSNLEVEEGRVSLSLDDGHVVAADAVVAGIGLVPNTALAEQAGLSVDDGIVVDHQLRTNDDAIYAAGDVANFYNPLLDRRMRVEHEDNALSMGRLAGRNMAGAEETYDHLPFFYSDLFDVGYEAVGELQSTLECVGVRDGLHDPGVWAYLHDGQVRGVLLWNLFGKVDAGRALIDAGVRFTPPELEKKLRAILDDAGSAT